MKSLIVNADDCNLTRGVTRAILECCEKGIVSSTTWLVNFETDAALRREVQKSGLGVGLHLNVTLGKPVSNFSKVRSLVNAEGVFNKRDFYKMAPPAVNELIYEYENQLALFEKHFNRLPTHFDTHHQLHDEPIFMQALAHIACKQRLPIRRSHLMDSADFTLRYPGIVTTQALLGNLNAHIFWTTENVEKALENLFSGTTEMMCHPGILDEDLKKITSMTVTREKEYELFSSPSLKKILAQHKIRLIHFGEVS